MKYALIGCGMISKNHINAALEAGLEIVAFCDLVEQNTQNALEIVPEKLRQNIKCYADYHQMLKEQHPDLVAIALGSGLKRKLSVDCMKAGANVIVEKPIALSLEDADAMIATAKECGMKLCVCHQLRFVPSVRAMHEACHKGDFGKLLHGAVQVRRNRNKAYFDAGKWRGTWAQDGGTLMNQCIHYTDLLTWCMGTPIEVFAYTDNLAHPFTEAEDMGLALVKFDNGSYGMIEGTINTYPKNLNDSMAIFGTEGTVSVSGKFLDEVERWEFETIPSDLKETVAHYSIADQGTGHAPFYKNVVAALEGREELMTSPEDARSAIELILAIYESSATGKPVKLPLEKGATIDYVGLFDR